MEDGSPVGIGFRRPKNSDGSGTRETDRVVSLDLGLEGGLELPAGLKAGAAALGLNSDALTLNLRDTADVGVCRVDR